MLRNGNVIIQVTRIYYYLFAGIKVLSVCPHCPPSLQIICLTYFVLFKYYIVSLHKGPKELLKVFLRSTESTNMYNGKYKRLKITQYRLHEIADFVFSIILNIIYIWFPTYIY